MQKLGAIIEFEGVDAEDFDGAEEGEDSDLVDVQLRIQSEELERKRRQLQK